MFLSQIDIFNFKGIEESSCRFSKKLNGFFGGNGMGKTNLLDAIHYLSLVRSHLGTIDRLSVRQGTLEANISGVYLNEGEKDRISLRIRTEKNKQLSRNGKLYTRLSDHIGRFPLVIISPQDYRIIRGGSSDRRKFIDRLYSQLDKEYLQALVTYEHALQQRNTMLRQQMSDKNLYAVVEQQMGCSGSFIALKRKTFIEDFSPIFNRLYHEVSNLHEKVGISYLSEANLSIDEYVEMLRKSRELDLKVGTTTFGVQKDDLALYMGEELVRKVGSEGQNKTFIIGLKFAEYDILSSTIDKKPILLLDDLFDKLDETRVSNIISLVSHDDFGQIFITDTNRKYLDEIIAKQGGDYELFEISSGNIKAF